MKAEAKLVRKRMEAKVTKHLLPPLPLLEEVEEVVIEISGLKAETAVEMAKFFEKLSCGVCGVWPRPTTYQGHIYS